MSQLHPADGESKGGVELGEGQSRVLDYSVKVLARNFYRSFVVAYMKSSDV